MVALTLPYALQLMAISRQPYTTWTRRRWKKAPPPYGTSRYYRYWRHRTAFCIYCVPPYVKFSHQRMTGAKYGLNTTCPEPTDIMSSKTEKKEHILLANFYLYFLRWIHAFPVFHLSCNVQRMIEWAEVINRQHEIVFKHNHPRVWRDKQLNSHKCQYKIVSMRKRKSLQALNSRWSTMTSLIFIQFKSRMRIIIHNNTQNTRKQRKLRWFGYLLCEWCFSCINAHNMIRPPALFSLPNHPYIVYIQIP